MNLFPFPVTLTQIQVKFKKFCQIAVGQRGTFLKLRQPWPMPEFPFFHHQKSHPKSTNREDVLNVDHDSEGNDADPFGQKLFSFQQEGDVYEAVIVGRSGQYAM